MANPQIAGRDLSDDQFTNLLASAYSLQQRHDQIKGRVTASKFSDLVSAVLDIQKLVLHHTIHTDTAMHLIASRTQKLCGSAGTAIALVNGEDLEYKVAIGIADSLHGAKILADASSSFQQLRSEEVVESDTWRDNALHTRVLAKSTLTVPIHREGTLAGCIQLFSRLGHFDEGSIYTCELMSEVLTQVIEEIDPPRPCKETVRAILDTTNGTDLEAREQASQQIGKNGSALKPDDQLKPQCTNSIAAAPIKAETLHQLQSLPLKQKLLWPIEPERPAGAGEDTSDPRVGKQLLGLPGRNFRNYHQNAQTQVESNQRTDLSIGGVGADHPIGRNLSPETNGNDPDRNFPVTSSTPRIWTRLRTTIYPVFVIFFVGFANVPGWSRGWLLELATIIMVAFTTAELFKIWLKREQKTPAR